MTRVALLNDIREFDQSSLINRLDYPRVLREWVYNNQHNNALSLATYICHSAGYQYVEDEGGWGLRENDAVCDGCKCKTLNYICSKTFKQVFCFDCWFDCDRKFI